MEESRDAAGAGSQITAQQQLQLFEDEHVLVVPPEHYRSSSACRGCCNGWPLRWWCINQSLFIGGLTGSKILGQGGSGCQIEPGIGGILLFGDKAEVTDRLVMPVIVQMSMSQNLQASMSSWGLPRSNNTPAALTTESNWLS